jgi:hypothetical protein
MGASYGSNSRDWARESCVKAKQRLEARSTERGSRTSRGCNGDARVAVRTIRPAVNELTGLDIFRNHDTVRGFEARHLEAHRLRLAVETSVLLV